MSFFARRAARSHARHAQIARRVILSQHPLLSEIHNRCYIPRVPHSHEGASPSSRTSSAGCDGRIGLAGERYRCVRSSRVVLIPRRWDQVNGDHPLTTGASKPGTPGRARSSRKAIAQGMPECFGQPVVTMLVGLLPFSAHKAAGAVSARHSLRPLFPGGTRIEHHPGENAPRECRFMCRHC